MPAVSIIVPVYNRGALLREAVDSALAADVDLEIVIVDDASTDDTPDVIASMRGPRIRAVRMEQNGGQSRARNRGIDEARGRCMKFLDSDDLLEPSHLERELKVIAEEQADICVSGWRATWPDGTTRTWDAPQFTSVADDVLAGLAVPTSSALYVRRDDWRWDPELRKLDDWDYCCQAVLGAKRIAVAPGVAYTMREHTGARVTHVSMLHNAREHHHILYKIERRLEGEGLLTEPRKKRLAQYFYKELRVLTLHDPQAADAALEHIFALDPRFQPRDEERSRAIRAAARLLGVRNTLRLYKLAKRAMMAR